MNPKKILFMLNKLYHDITSTGERYRISKDLYSEKLGEYYFLFEEDTQKLNRLITGFDDEGIPVNSPYIDVENPKTHYYPISIGQYGLAVFNSFILTRSDEKKNHFIRIANWFYSNSLTDDKLGTYWLTNIPKPEYKVEQPWKSAFTQSRAISILLRAWQITNDEKYLAPAMSALLPFTFSIKDGGVSAFSKHGKFYEEYVAAEPTMVLDGHMFSMLGLFDCYRALKNHDPSTSSLAKDLFDEGLTSLIQWLPEYDMGYWLRFNMCNMEHYPETDPCTIGYLKLIIQQLELLFRMTGNQDMDNYMKKFSGYDKLFNKLRMYPVKYNALKKLNRV